MYIPTAQNYPYLTLTPHSDPLNDPLATSQILSPPTIPSPSIRTPRLPSPKPGSNLSNLTSSAAPSFHTARTSLTPGTSSLAQKSFPHLLRPEIYHPLPTHDIPPSFLNSSHQPEPNTSLEGLVASGSFRHAAITAANLLISSSLAPTDYEEIFRLLYIRLSCLTRCGRTDIAAQESRILEGLGSGIYRIEDEDGAARGRHVVPWELRVLAVRLQGLGFGDVRRGVVGYYELAKEVRMMIAVLRKARKAVGETDGEGVTKMDEEIHIWEDRLQDLGIRVASALIEMEDLEGAMRHLRSLPIESPQLKFQKALLCLAIGDVRSARSCFPQSKPSDASPEQQGDERPKQQIIEALSLMADGSYPAAAKAWESLLSSSSSSDVNKPLNIVNLSICHLYLGQGDEARQELENLVEEGHNFHALTFNLCTLFELCTERSRALKVELGEKIAEQKGVEGMGWEKVVADFKL